MNRLLTVLILILFIGCSTENTNSKYFRWVGDSKFNPEIDKENFSLCYSENRVKQYFNFSKGLQYEGEKRELFQYIMENYNPVKSKQNGWIRIRFIVNCRGETGRFRVISSDENYKIQEFDEKIKGQLLEITKSLEGWKVLPNENEPEDYYQYLIFKIREGRVIEIMP